MTAERDVVTYFDKKVKELGGETRKLAYEGRNGATDKLVLLPGYHCVAELKRPGKDARINQAREHDRLRAAGFDVLVIATLDEVDEWYWSRRVRMDMDMETGT